MGTVGPGTWVELHYTIKDAKGRELDSTRAEGRGPVGCAWGSGVLVPGVEAALEGASAGEVLTVVTEPDDGFGPRSERDVFPVDRDELPDPAGVKVGDEFDAEGPDGAELTMRVIEVGDEHVVVDANHPFAGMTLEWVVQVLKVRPAG